VAKTSSNGDIEQELVVKTSTAQEFMVKTSGIGSIGVSALNSWW
jgi:hypothetical protein